MKTSTTASLFLLLGLGVATGCGSKLERPHADPDADTDADTDVDTGSDTGEEDAGIPPAVLSVTSVNPTHGPWTGGNAVEIRGTGFGGPFFSSFVGVTVQGRPVDPLDVEVVSPQMLRVLVGPRHLGLPPGDVGPADIEVSMRDPAGVEPDEVAVLPGGGDVGYTYDAFYVDPPRGTIGGGTKVTLYGSQTIWNANAVVTFDGAAATDCTVLATQIDCKTPPGEAGDADVRVDDPVDGLYHDLVEDGFEYYNSADPIGGGLGGGPMDGQLNVTVLSWTTLLPVEGAFVIVGTDGDTDHRGLTNALGQIVFNGDDLVGRQELTAAKEGYETTSFVQFDARDATIFLVPIPDPNPGPPPPGRFPATLDGVLVFDGPNEFGPNPWLIIPDPVDPDEVKVCYVSTTQSDIFRENPPPGAGRRVLEVDPGRAIANDYRYQIIARPAAMAVWAICGLEIDNPVREDNGRFLPYAMGVRRDVIGGPGVIVEDADIRVDIPLDHLSQSEFGPTPVERDNGPNRYRSETYVDLGGEGVIARDDRYVASVDPLFDFRFPAQPPLMNTIGDGQWTFVGGAYTWSDPDYVNPFSVVIEKGILDTADPILLDGFLGVPSMVDPPYAGTLEDNTFTWEADIVDEVEGAVTSTGTFNVLLIQTNTAPPTPVWRAFVRGDEISVEIPDLATIEGLPELPEGYLVSIVWSIRVPDLSFDEFSYTYYVNNNYWSAYAADAFLFQAP